jgi:hypothetical protein
MKLLIVSITLLLVQGCSTFGSKSPSRNFPGEVKPQLYGSLNRSEEIIKSVGVHHTKDNNVTFETRPGEKNFRGTWGWKSTELNMWVVGLATQRGRLLQVAYKPGGNPYAINWNIVLHEFGHHWLIGSGTYGHPHQYDRYFENWKLSRNSQGQSFDLNPADGVTILSVEVVEGDGIVPLANMTQLSVTYEFQGETYIACGYSME